MDAFKDWNQTIDHLNNGSVIKIKIPSRVFNRISLERKKKHPIGKFQKIDRVKILTIQTGIVWKYYGIQNHLQIIKFTQWYVNSTVQNFDKMNWKQTKNCVGFKPLELPTLCVQVPHKTLCIAPSEKQPAWGV